MSTRISSEKVVIAGRAWNAIFSQAAREGAACGDNNAIKELAGLEFGDVVYKALSMLVLYDEVIVPHKCDDSPRIPVLEQEEFFKPVSDTLEVVNRLRFNWSMEKDKDAVQSALARVLSVKSFIVNGMLSMSGLEEQIRIPPGFTRSSFYGSVLEHVHSFCVSNKSSMQNSTLSVVLGPTAISKIEADLVKTNRSLDASNAIDLILMAAFSALDHAEMATRLSSKYSAATTVPPLVESVPQTWDDAVKRVDAFALVQVALDQELDRFPKIESINDALKLRKDPNVAAFRRQLNVYQQCVYDGNMLELARIREDVRRAHEILEQNNKCRDVLKLISYVSYPVGIAEVMLHCFPVFGSIAKTVSFLGSISSDCYFARNRWVLLGR